MFFSTAALKASSRTSWVLFQVMDGQPLIHLDLCNLSGNLLSLGDEIDYLQVNPG